MRTKLLPLITFTLFTSLSAPVSAIPLFETFGALPEATFGGSGIPNDAVAISEVTVTGLSGPVTLTLGLTATERFSNPAVTNDGAGTFFASTGLNDGLVGSPLLGATWNFGFFAGLSSGTFADLPGLAISLFYDTDPSPGGAFNVMDLSFLLAALGDPFTTSTMEASENLAFGYLNGIGPPVPGIFFSGFPFDPSAPGLYEFLLLADDSVGGFGAVGIDVLVSAAVPTPGALAIIGSGLVLLGFRQREST